MAKDDCKECVCPDRCPAHSGIEAHIKNTREDIHEIKTNHLPHIYARLNAINAWLIGVLVSIIMLLLATVVSK